MSRIVDRDATSVILFLQLTTTAGTEIDSILHSDPLLVIQYRTSGSGSWTTVTKANMTLGSWTTGGWKYTGSDGTYEFGLPNAAIMEGEEAIVRVKYDTNKAQFGSVCALSIGSEDITFSVPTSVLESIAAEAGNSIAYRGTRWQDTLEGVASIVGATAIYYAVKATDVPDADALIQVRLNLNAGTGDQGLVRINKGVPLNANQASIVASTYTEGAVTLNRFVCVIDGEATALVPPTVPLRDQTRNSFTSSTLPSYYTEWKIVGDADMVLASGQVAVLPDVNRATS